MAMPDMTSVVVAAETMEKAIVQLKARMPKLEPKMVEVLQDAVNLVPENTTCKLTTEITGAAARDACVIPSEATFEQGSEHLFTALFDPAKFRVLRWKVDGIMITEDGEDTFTASIPFGQKEMKVTVDLEEIPESEVIAAMEVQTAIAVSPAGCPCSATATRSADRLTMLLVPTLATDWVVEEWEVNGKIFTPTSADGSLTYTLTATDALLPITMKCKDTSVSRVVPITVLPCTNGNATAVMNNDNTKLVITATPDTGYQVDTITVNGTAITGTEYEVQPTDTALEVAVTFATV